MKNKFLKFFAGIILFVVTIIAGLMVYNVVQTSKYKDPVEDAGLNERELAATEFVYHLRQQAGEQIWPGFDTSAIPLILFNDQYEFILGPAKDNCLDAQDVIRDDHWYRKTADNPQAFAVKLGDTWAGSLGVQQQMNREMYNGIKSEMPSFIGRIFPFFLISVSEEMHIAGIVHEMFHAYQGICNEEKFLEADGSHRFLKNYPYDNEAFIELWNKEGSYLQKALYAENQPEMEMFVDSFLMVRTNRRNSSGINQDIIRAEKQLEWLEGSAKYAESVSYEIAADLESDQYSFKSKNAYWELERKQQLGSLGESGGDNRFYNSGAAMAFLLDQLDPSWKSSAMKDSVYLEDLLAAVAR